VLDDGYRLPVDVEAEFDGSGRVSYGCPSSRLPWYRSPDPSPPKPGRRDRPLEPDWPETLLLVPELDDMLLSPYLFLSDWMEYRADDSRSSHSSLRRLIGWSLKIGKADGFATVLSDAVQ
jgi:hypothetical protein